MRRVVRRRLLHGLTALALLGAVLLTFRLAPDFAFVALDDDAYVTANPRVRAGLTPEGVRWALTSFVAGNWHPLTVVSHMLDVTLHGLRPGGHHLTNVLIHALNTLLLWWLLFRMTGARWRSAAVAALFGVHPLHVESVAWVAQRKDVLSTLFWLLATLAYVAYARRRTALRYLGVAGCLALGLSAKPMPVTLPFTLLLLDVWPLGRSRAAGAPPAAVWRGLVLEKLPLLALAAAAGVVTLLAQAGSGAVASLVSRPLASRAANAVVSYGWYALKAAVPTGLAVPYPMPEGGWPGWLVGLAGAALALATVMAARLAASRPFLLTGWLWYLGTLVPVIGLVQVGMQARADRYAYVPLIGLFVAAVWAAGDFAAAGRRCRVVLPAFAVVLVLFSVLSTAQTRVWRNSLALFRHSLSVLGESPPTLVNLGVSLLTDGSFPEAVTQFERALQLDPANSHALYNLGIAAALQGRGAEALARFDAALPRIRDPHVASKIENHRGELLLGSDPQAALAAFRRARELNPDNPSPLYNLGNWQLRTGRYAEAAEHFTRVLAMQPENAWARSNLGFAAAGLGKTAEAIGHLRAAVRQSPGLAVARYNLGNLLLAGGELAEAEAHLREAVRTDPTLWQALEQLGDLLARRGDAPGAADAYRRALALRPGEPRLLSRLESVLKAPPSPRR